MRAILLAVLLLPLAAATPATEPYAWSATFDADPQVGRAVVLTVSLEARRALDAPLRLDVPSWIAVDEPLEWRAHVEAGARAEHTWSVTPTRAGFWRAALAVDASRADAYAAPVDPGTTWQPVGGCCLYVWSTDGRGMFSERPESAVPGESTVGFHPSFRTLDAERAELVVRVSPQDQRYVGQELVFQVPLGSPDVQTAPADSPHEFVHAFPLAHGESAVVTPAASVRITFEGGEHPQMPATWSQHVACANLHVERVGDDVREVGRTGCEASASRPRGVPAAPWLVAVLIAVAVAAPTASRQRSTHGTNVYHSR